MLRTRRRTLPHLVVLALGNNGPLSQRDVDETLRILGPNRLLALVTPHHGDLGYVPGVVRKAALRHRGRILLIDWDRFSAGRAGFYAPDGTHLAARGIDAYADLIARVRPFASQPCPT